LDLKFQLFEFFNLISETFFEYKGNWQYNRSDSKMEDTELNQLRQKRMAELQQQQQQQQGGQQQQQQEEMKRQQQEFKNNILTQVLTQEARARCEIH
jgi:hypothetical protein